MALTTTMMTSGGGYGGDIGMSGQYYRLSWT